MIWLLNALLYFAFLFNQPEYHLFVALGTPCYDFGPEMSIGREQVPPPCPYDPTNTNPVGRVDQPTDRRPGVGRPPR